MTIATINIGAVGNDGTGDTLRDAGAKINANFASLADERISVKDYGAVGDGVADDTAAIQEAIDENPGKIIFFPAGIYNISAAITVSADNTTLMGAGVSATFLWQTVDNIDIVQFAPTTAGTTAAYLNGVEIRDLYIRGLSSSTSGSGVRFTQCNGYRLDSMVISHLYESITVEGGQLGSLRRFSLFASTGVYKNTALLCFRGAVYSSSRQKCFTVQVEDFRISTTMLRNGCILIENGDGLNFVNGYMAYATSLTIFNAVNADDSVLATSFTNVYFDCVNEVSTAVIISAGDASSVVSGVSIGSGCIIGNGTYGVTNNKVNTRRILIQGAQFTFCDEWAYYQSTGSTSDTILTIAGCVFNTCGLTGVIYANTGDNVTIANNQFSDCTGSAVILNGTWNQATVVGNNNNANITDLTTSGATFTSGLVVAGNTGRSTTAASHWRGSSFGNVDSSDVTRLDYYLEGTFTPAVTFGGGATGVTYTAQTGTYTRIGNRVIYSLRVVLSAKGSSTGEFRITGLPFTASDSNMTYPAAVRMNNTASDLGASAVVADVLGAATSIRLLFMDTSGATELATPVTDTYITSTTNILISGTYRCA